MVSILGVYFEKILKKYKTDMWTQNIRLGLLTLVFATFTMIASDAEAIAIGELSQIWSKYIGKNLNFSFYS